MFKRFGKPKFHKLEQRRKTRKQRSQEKKQAKYRQPHLGDEPPKDNRNVVSLIGKKLDLTQLRSHMLWLGITRSGKSLMYNQFLQSLIKVQTDHIKNLILLDAKGDLLSWVQPLCEKCGIKLNIIKLEDARSGAIDFGRMVDGNPLLIKALVAIIVPVPDKGEPFWALSAQEIAIAIIQCLIYLKDNTWGIHDFVDISSLPIGDLIEYLSQCPTSKEIADKLLGDEGGANTKFGILTQLNTSVSQLRACAELQRNTPPSQWISYEDIVGEEDVVTVFSASLQTMNSTSPIVRFMFEALVGYIGSQEDRSDKIIFFSADELPVWKPLPKLDVALQFLTSKGFRASIVLQDVSAMFQIYGKEKANAILGNCGFQVYFTPASSDSAKWITQQVGERYVQESSLSLTSQGRSISRHKALRPYLVTSDLFKLRIADKSFGVEFFARTIANWGGIYKCHISSEEVEKLKPKSTGKAFIRASYTKKKSRSRLTRQKNSFSPQQFSFDLLQKLRSSDAKASFMKRFAKFPFAESIWEFVTTIVEIMVEDILNNDSHRRK